MNKAISNIYLPCFYIFWPIPKIDHTEIFPKMHRKWYHVYLIFTAQVNFATRDEMAAPPGPNSEKSTPRMGSAVRISPLKLKIFALQEKTAKNQ